MIAIDFLYGIILLSMVPVRNEPAEQSEMVTQLLFGETFTIVERQGGWLHIKNTYDGYQGWIYERTAFLLDTNTYSDVVDSQGAVVVSYNAIVTEEGQPPTYIVKGSSLPNYDSETKSFTVGNRKFYFEGEIVTSISKSRDKMLSHAYSYLNTPYLWGGRSPYGLDCSGFTQQIAKLVGISLARDASQQMPEGNEVSFLENVKPGDFAFFDNQEGRVVHVGMLISKNRIIHASGKVRIDSIDQEGIYNLELKRYTHHLCSIKNIVD